jgi:hypothetical protein
MSTPQTEESSVVALLNAFAAADLPANASSSKLEASHFVLSGAGYLLSFVVSNTNASAQFIQFFDQTQAPGSGAVPRVVFTVSGSADRVVSYPLPGRLFYAGIWVANSSTSATLTAGSADCFFDVQYLPAY